MDSLFWILAGVVVGCGIGIIFIWRLEIQAERRAADTQRVEAEVSERLKVFDPRVAVEEVDTRPIPATPQPESQPAPRPFVVEASHGLAEKLNPPSASRGRSVAGPAAPPILSGPLGPAVFPGLAPSADVQMLPAMHAGSQPSASMEPPPPATLPPISAAPEELRPLPMNGAAAQLDALANGTAELAYPVEALPSTPEAASLRAAELGRERRYLEQAIEEQQARLEQLMHNRTPGNSQELVAIHVLQSELAEQRHHLEEIIFLEERYRQAATPSLEQLAQDYKNAASPHTPRAFGVRRHSLAPLDPPGKNPPAPPAQAKTDSSL